MSTVCKRKRRLEAAKKDAKPRLSGSRILSKAANRSRVWRLEAMASNLIAMVALASNLLAMASNLQPRRDGLQPRFGVNN